jgi:hypothetical protein
MVEYNVNGYKQLFSFCILFVFTSFYYNYNYHLFLYFLLLLGFAGLRLY